MVVWALRDSRRGVGDGDRAAIGVREEQGAGVFARKIPLVAAVVGIDVGALAPLKLTNGTVQFDSRSAVTVKSLGLMFRLELLPVVVTRLVLRRTRSR